MGLLSKLKSMLGIEESERAPGSGVDVTVEREPGDDSKTVVEDDEAPGDEPAAAGSGAAASTESLVDEAETDDPDRAAEPAEAAGSADDEDADYVTTDADVGTETVDTEPDADADTDAEPEDEADAEPEPDDLTDIKGVGPAYANRLNDAGVTTFAALADADPEELAAETDLSPKRVGRWIDRAGDR